MDSILGDQKLKFDPVNKQSNDRLVSLYPISFCAHPNTNSQSLTSVFHFGRLSRFIDRAQEELPRVIHIEELDAELVSGSRSNAITLERVNLMLFSLSPTSGLILLSQAFEPSDLSSILALQEDSYYRDFKVGDAQIESVLVKLCERFGSICSGDFFQPEFHQIFLPSVESPVFIQNAKDEEDLIQRILYRADLEYEPEHSVITYPSELNRRPASQCAMSPYVTFLKGQQEYVENACMVSAGVLVGVARQIRLMRAFSHSVAEKLQLRKATSDTITDRREFVRQSRSRLALLELELAASVEISRDIGMVIPAMRVEAFHDGLARAIALERKIDVISDQAIRIANSLENETAVIKAHERHRDERHRKAWSTLAGFIATISIPLGIFFGFFGVAAPEVDSTKSMFDWNHYWGLYAFILLLLGTGALIALVFFLCHPKEPIDAEQGSGGNG